VRLKLFKLGGGKTTFLSLLARRLEATTGDMWINDKSFDAISFKEFRSLVGFVGQNDAPVHGLTPRETLTYYTMLEVISLYVTSLISF
jgi:ABC-type multidrug transport system ATPase subunit